MNDIDFIKIKNLTYSTKDKELFSKINWDLYLGKCTMLIGENGSGKTTLSKIIIGIIKDYSGEVFLNGKLVNNYTLAEIGKEVGYCFQNPDKQIFNPTVKDEMTFVNRFIDYGLTDYKELLKQFNIEHLSNSKTLTLSQGEKRRLALATTFLLNPKFLVLDEPTSGLDFKNRSQLYRIINSLRDKGIGFLIITHDMDLVNNCGDIVYEIKDRGIKIAKKI